MGKGLEKKMVRRNSYQAFQERVEKRTEDNRNRVKHEGENRPLNP